MTPQELAAKTGEVIGTSDWFHVTQERINMFADATGDHQFIHIDEEKAKMTPFGGTIAHGFLTLSLASAMSYDAVVPLEGVSMGVNYGANKVRFPSPVPVGSKVRLGVKVLEVEEIANGVQMTMEFTFECEGSSKPSCVAEIIFRSYV